MVYVKKSRVSENKVPKIILGANRERERERQRERARERERKKLKK